MSDALPTDPRPDARTFTGSPPPRIGSYRLLHQLGSGGMSSVFHALHVETGHEVAVKVLPRSLARNPTLLQRFLREAKNAEALEHPQIVAIYDRGSEAGRYYLVLEYVPGSDLHDRVRSKGPLPVAEAVRIVREVAEGLRYAAGKGLIHRDIKPANLLLSHDGQVKIADLGLALQQAEEEDERVTRDGTTVGTVDYMAPEQARDSRATSIKSDIYSLGCTFYFLLTGTPPFPGGDIAEKLRHHAIEPPPDVRDHRPEVSEALARLIQRMMAKRPEKRFDDYDRLIEALDRLPAAGAAEAPLMALIDDQDDDAAPPLALIDDDEDAAPPLALIDDEDISADFTLGQGPGSGGTTASAPNLGTPAGSGRRPGAPSDKSDREVDFSELANLVDEEEHAPPLHRPEDRPPSPIAMSAPLPPMAPEPVAFADLPPPIYVPARDPAAVRMMILRGATAGVAIVLVGILVAQLVRLASPVPGEDVPGLEDVAQTDESTNGPISPLAPRAGRGKGSNRNPKPEPPWHEPSDPRPAVVTEPSYPPELVHRLGLEGAEKATTAPLQSPVIAVRRVGRLDGHETRPDLGRAFDTIGGTALIADNGPFFEDDMRINGRSKLIRAADGYRPIIVIGRPILATVRERPAVFNLGPDPKDLTLEGIDLVIDRAALPRHQAVAFLCQGGSLTLRDCTVTVVGQPAWPFALVQLGVSGTPGNLPMTRVRLERTLIRGPALTAFRLAEGPAEIVVSRSALICGRAPAVTVGGGARVARSIGFDRSIVTSGTALIDLAGTPATVGATRPVLRALGSTFARLDGPGDAHLIALKPVGGKANGPGIDWLGDSNSFEGWTGWLNSPETPIAGLDSARAVWKGTDGSSRESATPWHPWTEPAWAPISWLRARAPSATAILTRLATPWPYLAARTLGSFDRQRPFGTGPSRPVRQPATAGSAGPATQSFVFDAAPGADLGRFLADRIRPNARQVLVTARGSGTSTMTPIRMPPGVSLTLQAEPDASAAPALTFEPVHGATGAALIDVRGADLELTGIGLARGPSTEGLGALVRVEQGHLTLTRCRLTAPATVDEGRGGLIDFRSDGTHPLPHRAGRSGPQGDRPTCHLTDCLLLTGGEALTADLGRGVVALENCAVLGGRAAFVLKPQAVARKRLEADLQLDRCTVIAAADFLRLGPWPGQAPGPDRPWLVSTRRTAFLDPFDRGRNQAQAVLLRTEPAEALAHGALVWQSEGDAFDVRHFAASGDEATRTVRADLKHDWVDLWGPSHIVGATGPGFNSPGAGVRLAVPGGRIVPGNVQPEQLALDPSFHPGRRSLDLGADAARLGIAPAARSGK